LTCGILIPQVILRFTSTPHQHRHGKTAFDRIRVHSPTLGGIAGIMIWCSGHGALQSTG
jgi:hypothetical protein